MEVDDHLARPILHSPGTLSFDAWLQRAAPYLAGMQDYLERILAHASPPPGMLMHIDMPGLRDAFAAYVYKTSINRFKQYTIIH